MGKQILSVFAGMVTALLLITLIEGISSMIFTPPEGVDFNDPESLKAYIEGLPIGAKLWVIMSHLLGALGGGLVAGLITPPQAKRNGLIVGGIILITAIINLFAIPYHPLWFTILDLVFILPAAYAGALLSRRLGNPAS